MPKVLRSAFVNFPERPSAGVASTEKLFVYTTAHVAYYLYSKCLGVVVFSVVTACQGCQAFGQADKAYSESALVYNGFYCIVRA